MGRKRLAAGCAALLLLAAGCGSADELPPAEPEREATPRGDVERPAPKAPLVPCPPEVAECVSARGEIVYVERVDPDGDGDAHFVLLSGESVTGPGITVVDVRPDLRPSPLPGPGDSLSAAGPVYPGSYGQRQIEAVDVAVARGG